MRIAVAARKGGVSKTTTAVELSLAAVEAGAELVVLADCDRQASATGWVADAEGLPGVELVAVTHRRLLIELDRRFPLNSPATVVFDCAPGVGDWALTEQVMAAADLVVIPMRPTSLDLDQLRQTVDAAAAVGTPAVVLLSQTRPTRSSRIVSEVLADLDDVPVLDTVVPMREAIALAAGTTNLVDPFPRLWTELVDAIKTLTEGD